MVQSEASIRKLQADLIVKVAATTMSCHRLTEEWQTLSCGEDESSCFAGAESRSNRTCHIPGRPQAWAIPCGNQIQEEKYIFFKVLLEEFLWDNIHT